MTTREQQARNLAIRPYHVVVTPEILVDGHEVFPAQTGSGAAGVSAPRPATKDPVPQDRSGVEQDVPVSDHPGARMGL